MHKEKTKKGITRSYMINDDRSNNIKRSRPSSLPSNEPLKKTVQIRIILKKLTPNASTKSRRGLVA